MRDPIARALSWVLSVLAPRRAGRRIGASFADRAASAPSASVPAGAPLVAGARPLGRLPECKSPYAREAAARQPFIDTRDPVRPYVAIPPCVQSDDPVRRAQAERRWALEMALRGIDVGPSVIHGVHVGAGNHTAWAAVGA